MSYKEHEGNRVYKEQSCAQKTETKRKMRLGYPKQHYPQNYQGCNPLENVQTEPDPVISPNRTSQLPDHYYRNMTCEILSHSINSLINDKPPSKPMQLLQSLESGLDPSTKYCADVTSTSSLNCSSSAPEFSLAKTTVSYTDAQHFGQDLKDDFPQQRCLFTTTESPCVDSLYASFQTSVNDSLATSNLVSTAQQALPSVAGDITSSEKVEKSSTHVSPNAQCNQNTSDGERFRSSDSTAMLMQDKEGELYIIVNTPQQPNSSEHTSHGDLTATSSLSSRKRVTTVGFSQQCPSFNLQEIMASLEENLKSREEQIRRLKESVIMQQKALRHKSQCKPVSSDAESVSQLTNVKQIPYSLGTSNLPNKKQNQQPNGCSTLDGFQPNGQDKEFLWLIGLESVVESMLKEH